MKLKLNPILWSGLFMVLALVITFLTAAREKEFFKTNQIISPDISLGWIIAYFFGVVLIMAFILFVIPLRMLQVVFRVIFALMFGWGIFVVATFSVPLPAAYTVAIIAGISWLIWPRIWLHNLLLLITLSGAGSIFGFLFTPLTFMIFMLIIAVYDLLAVRFGFMVWMAEKLSESTALPAFVFPRKITDWKLHLKNVRVGDLKEKESEEREYSILGGGDIGFPLMLAVSVLFESNLVEASIVGIFALIGIISAFLIQLFWLKGKPMPALPPIAFFSLVGYLIVTLPLK